MDIATGIKNAKYQVMLGVITRTPTADTARPSIRSKGESANPPTLPTKVPANQPAAPLETTAWAKDNEVAITKKLLHARSR